jgi:hypothetical protein
MHCILCIIFYALYSLHCILCIECYATQVVVHLHEKNEIEVVFHLQKKVRSSSSFNNAIDGTSLGEPVHGKISGSKNGDVNVVQIELEKGNKKFIQIDTKIKKDIAAMSFEVCHLGRQNCRKGPH